MLFQYPLPSPKKINDLYNTESQYFTNVNKHVDYVKNEKELEKTANFFITILKKYVPNFNKNLLEILDIGCGTGIFIKEIKNYGHKVKGIEISNWAANFGKQKYKLNILAMSYDNWFQSEAAIKNINQIAKNLDIDLISVKPRYEIFKKIIKSVVENDFYSIKNTQRASDICTTCISLIRFQCFKIALEKDIPFVVFGMSPGQAPIVTSVVKTNSQMVKKMQDIVYRPLKELIGNDIRSFFLEEKHFEKDIFPYSINPLSFLDYNENDIIEKIKTLGWKNPKDTDPNSTNCLLNAFANYIHKKKYGFNPYCYELSELIRDKKINREDALKKIDVVEDEEIIELISVEIGIK